MRGWKLRSVATVALATAMMLWSLAAFAQEEDAVAECTDTCLAAEDGCLEGCAEGVDGDECAEACTDESDMCIDACEANE